MITNATIVEGWDTLLGPVQAATPVTIDQVEEVATVAPSAINAEDSDTLPVTAANKEVREAKGEPSAIAVIRRVIWLEIVHKVIERTIWSATNAMKLDTLQETARVKIFLILD